MQRELERNRCVECYRDLGASNPRQLCGKTRCVDATPHLTAADERVRALHALRIEACVLADYARANRAAALDLEQVRREIVAQRAALEELRAVYGVDIDRDYL